MAASANTVQRETSWATATMMHSTTAIQSATRQRRSCSQPPDRPGSCSRTLIASSTVPCGNGDPEPSAALQRTRGGARFAAVVEEPVHDRTGPRDVGAEGAEPDELGAQRRGGEIVGRERSEVARTAYGGNRVEQLPAALPVACGGQALVEGAVDGGGRRLGLAARLEQHDPVVLRQVEPGQFAPVALAQLRAVGQE